MNKVAGEEGAANIGKTLKERGVEAEFLLDEGFTILQDVINHVSQPVGLIGVSEKGFVTMKLSVDSAATGHSSMPPEETNIGILAKAVSKYVCCSRVWFILHLNANAKHIHTSYLWRMINTI